MLFAIRHVVAQALDQSGEVGFFCGVVTGEGERGIEHRLHFRVVRREEDYLE